MTEAFRTVLNMSISGSVVIAAVLLGRLLLRRAPKKWSYLLWTAAAFRLCCPVGIRSAISLFGVIPEPVSAGEAANGTFGRLSYIPSAAVAPSATALPIDPPTVSTTALPSVTAAPVTAAPAGTASAVSAAASPMQTVLTVLSVLWLAGIAALIVYAAVDYLRLCRLTAAATKLDGEKAVFRSEFVRSPFILGFLRPRIYIPYTLTGKELEYVLAHERTHLTRGDHIVKAFSFILLALHWFNPLCWIAFLLMSCDMEMSCDERVLSRGDINAEYSTTLLSLASAKRFPAPNPLCFGEGAIKERIKNAMKYKKPKLIITLTAALLAVLIVAACATDPIGNKPEPNTAEPAETTAEPTAEATAAPTAMPTAKPTAAPTASPEPTLRLNCPPISELNETDLFFVQLILENNGRSSNGAKLNPDFDIDDPATWFYPAVNGSGEQYAHPVAEWGLDGRLKRFNCPPDEYNWTGDLNLSGCDQLDRVVIPGGKFKTLDLGFCPLNEGVYIAAPAVVRSIKPERICTPMLMITGTSISGFRWIAVPNHNLNFKAWRFDLTVNAEGAGHVGVMTGDREHYIELLIKAFPEEGHEFLGWYDAEGALVSTSPYYEITSFETANDFSDTMFYTAKFD